MHSPKATKTRGVMKMVDDGVNMTKQLSVLMNEKVRLKIFTDSRPLLESIGSLNQEAEKALRQSITFLKQSLEDGDVEEFSWIEGKDIVADILTKQGPKREVLEELMEDNIFKHALNKNNLVEYINDEITIKNQTTKIT